MYATEEFMKLPFFVDKQPSITRRNSICSYHEPVVFNDDFIKELNDQQGHKESEVYDSGKTAA